MPKQGVKNAKKQQTFDSCSVYQLKADYFSALERSDSFYVGFDINRIKNTADSFPGLLAWIGTNPEALDLLLMASAYNEAKYQLLQAYAGAGINYVDMIDVHESNRYRKGLNISLEKLAAEANVPFSWA
ncbi:MAG: hypothetical protein COT26_02475 [Candidatus Kerfeldbacteria bacterium CG08_land_8_20_14_0_20_43_14]|uniref:Uncharacterized protein n=1 Tax=Candidatus Kerfeldbacteria bacterium CG08_land_8_20_14_0_20_43_14 TaxID=2014246 RepID=A0A2H0YQ68_9BACT|nr:MAG: hypothetical protein COT26_02475 [Candidatus Kerfeldbacteria bacterium CG08_land_8_20_14_0_20_43_14]